MEKETDNFFRFICLMFEVVPDIMRIKLIQSYRNSNLQTLPSFLKDTDVLHTIFHLFFPAYYCCMKDCGIQRERAKGFSKKEWNILYDADSTRCCKQNPKDPNRICICCVTPKNIDESILDLSLLSLILINCCKLVPIEKEAIQSIREMKNEYVSHNSRCSLSNSDFESQWQRAEFHIKHLDSTNIYFNQRANLLHRPMDKSLMQKYFVDSLEANKIEYLQSENMKNLQASIVTGNKDMIKAFEKLQSSIEYQQRESNNAVDGIIPKRKLQESRQCSNVLNEYDNADNDMSTQYKKQKLERFDFYKGNKDTWQYKQPDTKPLDNYKEYISSNLLGPNVSNSVSVNMDFNIYAVKGLSKEIGFKGTDKFICGKCSWLFISLDKFLEHKEQCKIRLKENEFVKNEYKKYVVAKITVPTKDQDLSFKIEKEWQQGNINPQHSSIDVTYITTGCVVIWIKVDLPLYLDSKHFYSELNDLVKDIFQKNADGLPLHKVQVYDSGTGYVDNLNDKLYCGDCELKFNTLDNFISHKNIRCFQPVCPENGISLPVDIKFNETEDLLVNVQHSSSFNFESRNLNTKCSLNEVKQEDSFNRKSTGVMSAQLRRSARKRKNLPIVAAASARKKANQRVPDTMSVPAPQLPTVVTGTPFIPVTSYTGTYPMLFSQTGAGIYTSASTGPVDLTSTANTLLYSRVQNVPDQRECNTVTSQDPQEHSLDVPDSKTFDVTLMTALLRNLTHPADLTRIKHYRNYLAHLDDCKIDMTSFNTAWNDITGAIGRLGGEQMKQECDHMKTKPLDQTKKEIMIDINHSHNEIREIKDSLESLKLSHTEVKISLEVLQEKHAVVTIQMEKVKIAQKDTVSWNIRVKINDTLNAWKDNDDKRFINTRAAQYVYKCIQENKCVTVTASSGVGKTSILRHTALQLAEEYDVLLITDPSDIMKFYNPNTKILFVIDNLCGNFSVDLSDIKSWEQVMNDIKPILDKTQTKILAACRLQVYQDEKFDSLSVFKSCVCNILSKNICLSIAEKDSLARLYLKTKASEIADYYDLYDCFPLLCKLYNDNPKLDVTDLFQNPFSVYEAEIEKLWKKGYYTKYCALALCVMFNNKLNEEILTEEVDEVTKTTIKNTCEACKLDMGTSRLLLQSELDFLTQTFVKKEQNVYGAIHDKIFDFLVYYFGQNMVSCIIKNADIDLIKERFAFERRGDVDQFITIIPQKFHQIYIRRMIDDWSKGNVLEVFGNTNMKISQFRQTFLKYLKTLDLSFQKQLANICDKGKPFSTYDSYDTFETALLYSCYLGDISLIEWCCNHVNDMNRCVYTGKSPLMIGCMHGYTEVVKMLLKRGSGEGCYQCDAFGRSPLMMASEHGHLEIVEMLLEKGANCLKCDWKGVSSVMIACEFGHTKIAEIVLDWSADSNTCNNIGQSPLMKACEQGYTEIVNILLNRKADCNKCDNWGHSPLLKACEQGHTKIVKMLLDRGAELNKSNSYGHTPLLKAIGDGHASTDIVKMLLDKSAGCKLHRFHESINVACDFNNTEIIKMLLDSGADCNTCNDKDESPVMKSCGKGHTEIVKLLLERGADYNICDNSDQSPVMKACERGYTKIVNMLLDKGSDYNKCDKGGESPVMKACAKGHTEILKILLDRGADYTICDNCEQSPVMKACERGHTKIVNMLLNKGADYNKCDKGGESPVMKACTKGHTEIVNELLDKGADYNNCDNSNQSPLMKACEQGHIEIVKMLLDRGADFFKCDKSDKSTVRKACERGHIELIKMLLNRGADCNKCDKSEQSPVLKACEQGHIEIVKILLDRGADFNKCDKMGESPVMKTCKRGQTEILKMLLDKGAKYDNCDRKGHSPIMTASQYGHAEIVKMLMDREATNNECDSMNMIL